MFESNPWGYQGIPELNYGFSNTNATNFQSMQQQQQPQNFMPQDFMASLEAYMQSGFQQPAQTPGMSTQPYSPSPGTPQFPGVPGYVDGLSSYGQPPTQPTQNIAKPDPNPWTDFKKNLGNVDGPERRLNKFGDNLKRFSSIR